MDILKQLLSVEEDMKPLRDLKKKIRAEAKGYGFKLSEIDTGMRLMTMEDQSIFVAEIEQLIEIAQAFNALPPGEQGNLFPDRRPADERAFAAGKQAGLEGKNCEAPAGYDAPKWTDGWHEGQRIMRDELQVAMEKRNTALADNDPGFPDEEAA
ncbi:hypothetical protein GCM10011491_30550 [Brucella endophytica]|uniref:Uncharacterized protein n=2 Tax=Brucella endophytica TaxID=1963359 RepID=A0A916SJ83_9HYPH|nr:hypothetical protein GCM10011491_30550 [Brucella endophytica]